MCENLVQPPKTGSTTASDETSIPATKMNRPLRSPIKIRSSRRNWIRFNVGSQPSLRVSPPSQSVQRLRYCGPEVAGRSCPVTYYGDT